VQRDECQRSLTAGPAAAASWYRQDTHTLAEANWHARCTCPELVFPALEESIESAQATLLDFGRMGKPAILPTDRRQAFYS
jgi:hypothetical protein